MNFKIQCISFIVVLRTAAATDILVETGFQCVGAVVLSVIKERPCNTAHKTYPNRTGMKTHCCAI
jgi:hypothetical protein